LDFLDLVIAKYNYWGVALLMMIGLYAMIAKSNLVKKIIGMNIFQTAIILFFISISAKWEATIPIIEHGHNGHGHGHAIHTADYMNPLPHVLMLTAIVVSVATLGVALALAVSVYQSYETLEEDEILSRLTDEQLTEEEPGR
jgi:multicomponent Na+:H+ antiporter subunit C